MRDGGPLSRIAFAPASRFEILDTWHSTGLAGSGSNDYRVKDLFVPDAHTISHDDPPRRPEPSSCYFGMFLASWHGIALGVRAGRSMRRWRSPTGRCTSSLLHRCRFAIGRMRVWRSRRRR
jgi:hypothetical protein